MAKVQGGTPRLGERAFERGKRRRMNYLGRSASHFKLRISAVSGTPDKMPAWTAEFQVRGHSAAPAPLHVKGPRSWIFDDQFFPIARRFCLTGHRLSYDFAVRSEQDEVVTAEAAAPAVTEGNG